MGATILLYGRTAPIPSYNRFASSVDKRERVRGCGAAYEWKRGKSRGGAVPFYKYGEAAAALRWRRGAGRVTGSVSGKGEGAAEEFGREK